MSVMFYVMFLCKFIRIKILKLNETGLHYSALVCSYSITREYCVNLHRLYFLQLNKK